MNGVVRTNTNPTVPGTGLGTGGVAPTTTGIPSGPPLSHPSGLAARNATPGIASQRPRNAALPTPLGRPGTSPMGARPLTTPTMSQASAPKQPLAALNTGTPVAGLGIGQGRADKPFGPRPMPTAQPAARPATAGPLPGQTPTARPTPPAVPPHTSSLPGQTQTAQTTRPTVQPQASSVAAQTPQTVEVGAMAQLAMPTPMQATGLSLMEQAMNGAVQQGVDPMVAMQAVTNAWGVQGDQGGMSGLPGVAMAYGDQSVGQAQSSMEGMMNHMSQVMMMQMKSQTEMAIMKMIVDMNMALAKEIKKAGQSVKDLAG